MSCNKSCIYENKKLKNKRKNAYPLISGLLIALLPKCPWCLLAYSSAITMCSGTTFYTPTNSWTTYLPILFSLFTLGLILYNFKGKKTFYAAALVVIGSLFILNATFYYGIAEEYYIGTFLLLFGVWINGSFLHFYNKIKTSFQSIFIEQMSKE